MHCDLVVTHLLGLICTKSKVTADNVNKIPNQSVEQTCVKEHRTRKTYEATPAAIHVHESHQHSNNAFYELDMFNNIENDYHKQYKHLM